MTETQKARLEKLQSIAMARRGRDTLSGLDQTTGLVGMDWVMDHESDHPKTAIRTNGYLYLDAVGLSGMKYRFTNGEPTKQTGNRIVAVDCPWVSLSYAPEWIKTEFAKRWDVRYVHVPVTLGRGRVRPQFESKTTRPVFPITPVIAWLRFLWPTPADFNVRVRKYVTGFTELYVHRHPGIGAQLVLNGPDMAPDYPAVVENVTALGTIIGLANGQYRNLREFEYRVVSRIGIF